MTLFYPEVCRTAEEHSVWATLKLFGYKLDLWISWFALMKNGLHISTNKLNQRNRHYQVSASLAIAELHPSVGSIFCSSLLIPTYTAEDSGATPEEECFWPLGCEWTGITPMHPFTHRDWDTCWHWGRQEVCGCQARPSALVAAQQLDSHHLAHRWLQWSSRACVMAFEKQHENRAQHTRDVCSHPVPNTWLPKHTIFPKVLYFPYCEHDDCSVSWAATVCRSHTVGRLWQGMENPGISFFLRTDIGKVTSGLSSGKHLMPADNKHIHSVIFASSLSRTFASVNVS